MKTLLALSNQTLADIAIEQYGSILAVMDIAVANDMSITDDVAPGQVVKLPASRYHMAETVNYFKGKGHKIATLGKINKPGEGVGYWIIQLDFQVK